MAMPLETPTPLSAKLTMDVRRPAWRRLRPLAEPVVEQRRDLAHRLRLVRALDLDAHGGAHRRGQQHHRYDVARAGALALHRQPHRGAELRCNGDDARARARMQAKRIDDRDDFCLHSTPRARDCTERRRRAPRLPCWSSILRDGSANLHTPSNITI